MLALKPSPGRALVELREKYEHVATTDQKYDTKTSGILLNFLIDNRSWAKDAEGSEIYDVKELNRFYSNLIGNLVFWEEYKDGVVIERDGKKYAFIKIEDLDGYEDVQEK